MREEDEARDLPWTEAQWETFMERQDIRSAKYGELLESFMDHPDREEIIAHEMGWISDEDEEEEEPEWRREAIEAMNQAAAEYDAMSDEEKEELQRRDREELEAIPAYSQGYKFGLKVHDALKSFVEQIPEEDFTYDNVFMVAYRDSLVIAAKICGGHGMGYEDDAICGNIVNCKRALAAAERCLGALQSLPECGVPTVVLEPLIDECKEVRGLVEERIVELRTKVWWD